MGESSDRYSMRESALRCDWLDDCVNTERGEPRRAELLTQQQQQQRADSDCATERERESVRESSAQRVATAQHCNIIERAAYALSLLQWRPFDIARALSNSVVGFGFVVKSRTERESVRLREDY